MLSRHEQAHFCLKLASAWECSGLSIPLKSESEQKSFSLANRGVPGENSFLRPVKLNTQLVLRFWEKSAMERGLELDQGIGVDRSE